MSEFMAACAEIRAEVPWSRGVLMLQMPFLIIIGARNVSTLGRPPHDNDNRRIRGIE